MIDYKKIIKSRAVRLKLLRLLSFIPDRPMLQLQYRIKTGRRLNLLNPQRFTEKIQWYKLYYKNPEMIRCVDKCDVREYVKEKGLEEILIPSYGTYRSVEKIEWSKLPPKFVMKDTLGGGGNSVITVTDMNEEKIEQLKREARRWTKINAHICDAGREWPYYSGKEHRIMFEEFLESDLESGGLIDFKFFCFYGEVKFLYVIADRQNGQGAGVGVFSDNFERLSVNRKDERVLGREIEKPANFEEMKKVAEVLAEGFPEVRVDLYNQNGKILFGELTFYDGSGYMEFEPDDFDYQIGAMFQLPKK